MTRDPKPNAVHQTLVLVAFRTWCMHDLQGQAVRAETLGTVQRGGKGGGGGGGQQEGVNAVSETADSTGQLCQRGQMHG